jgi:hypothetical protein
MVVQKTSVRCQVLHFAHGSSENIRQMAGGAFLRMRSSENIRQMAGGAFLRMRSSENIRQMSGGAFCAW